MCRKFLILVLAMAFVFSCACAQAEIVPFGESLSFQTQITSEGKARIHAGEAPFETLNFSIRLKRNCGPAYFKNVYEQVFALRGTEAVVEIELTMDGYSGNGPLNPNNVILLTLQAENGETASGYHMTDWEIGGSTTIDISGKNKLTLFKRYDFDEEDDNPMRYLAVHSFVDGVEKIFLMDMHDPKNENSFYIVYRELKRKDRGDEVKILQLKLQELGLLTGSSIDGVYGPGTEASVKEAQKLLGFEESGVASPEFLKALYKYGGGGQ